MHESVGRPGREELAEKAQAAPDAAGSTSGPGPGPARGSQPGPTRDSDLESARGPGPRPGLNLDPRLGRRDARRSVRSGPGPSARARWVGVDRVETADLLELVLGRPLPGYGAEAIELSEGGPRTGYGSGRAGGAPAPALPVLARSDPAELVRELGLRPREAERLAAAFALGRRVARHRCPPRAPLRSAERVAQLFADELAGLPQETFHVLALDGRHALLGRFEVSRGTLTTSLVHPREVFRPAIARHAAAVIGLHNHPSGDPEPSADDVAVTRRLIEAGRLLGIPLLDHVVLGAGRHVSLRARLDFDAPEARPSA